MIEQEGLPTHDLGPIQKGEEREIIESLDQFLLGQPESHRTASVEAAHHPAEEGYWFSDAPPGLIRRFLLYQAEGSDSWIPWKELPPDLFDRVSMADRCRQRIYQEARHDPQTNQLNLTSDNIRAIYEAGRPTLGRYHGGSPLDSPQTDFDLHDVYVCAEAMILEVRDEFSKQLDSAETLPYDLNQVYPDLITRYEAVLKVIGETISPTRAEGQPQSLRGI